MADKTLDQLDVTTAVVATTKVYVHRPGEPESNAAEASVLVQAGATTTPAVGVVLKAGVDGRIPRDGAPLPSMIGAVGSRPAAAGSEGLLYHATDSGSERTARSNGTIWEDLDHGSAQHVGNVFPSTPAPQSLGSTYIDVEETSVGSVPAPAAGHRRLYSDNGLDGMLMVMLPGGGTRRLENDTPMVEVELTGGGDMFAETLRPGPGIEITNDGDNVALISAPRLEIYRVKPTDETVDGSDTPQADDDLTAPVVDGKTYGFEIVGHVQDNSTSASGGFQATIGGTFTASWLIAQATLVSNSLLVIAEAQRWDSKGDLVGTSGADAVMFLQVLGSFSASGSGTFNLSWSQATLALGGTGVTLLRGSTLKLWEIP